MLQRRNRLRRSAEIRQVRRQGIRRRVRLASLFVLANELETSRFAISAGRYIGNAVTRNRAKRRVREIIRRHLHEIEQGWDCLFVLSPTVATATFSELEEDVLRLLARTNLLKPQTVRMVDLGSA